MRDGEQWGSNVKPGLTELSWIHFSGFAITCILLKGQART